MDAKKVLKIYKMHPERFIRIEESLEIIRSKWKANKRRIMLRPID